MADDVMPGVVNLLVEDVVKNPDGTARDMTGTTAITAHLVAPDGTAYTATGSWVGAITGGIAEATFVSKIDDQGGSDWRYQFAYAGIGNGNWHLIPVGENLQGVPSP